MMSIGVWAVGLGGWGMNGVWLGQRWDVLDDQAGLDQEQVDLKNKKIRLWIHKNAKISLRNFVFLLT